MNDVKQIKKIDIHAHATAYPEYFPPYYKGRRFMSAEEVIESHDQLGVGTGVLLPIVAAEGFNNRSALLDSHNCSRSSH